MQQGTILGKTDYRAYNDSTVNTYSAARGIPPAEQLLFAPGEGGSGEAIPAGRRQ